MALHITGIPRVFRFKQNNDTITLQDPDSNYSPEEVMSLYAHQYPELTTATVKGLGIQEDKARYEFVTTIGTKG